MAQGPKTLTAEGPLSIKANSLQTKDVRSLVIKWAPHSLRKEETSSPSVRSLQTPQLAPWPFENKNILAEMVVSQGQGQTFCPKDQSRSGKQDKRFWGLLFFKNTLKITCSKSDLCISTNRSQKALGYLEIIRLKFDNVDSAFPSIC